MLTTLVRCDSCSLLFRTPTTSSEENRRFYQRQYRQGFTTDLPDDAELARLKATAFKGSGKDFSRFAAILEAAGVPGGGKVFDFGCSWGYGSWQLTRAGYDVSAYEISEPRRDYAQAKLGVRVVREIPSQQEYDAFFSSHVLEHVPSVSVVVDAAMRCLRPGGVFIAETPNGSTAFRQKEYQRWQRLWGEVHPNFLDDVYWQRRFAGMPLYLGTPPYELDRIRRWHVDGGVEVADLTGDSLMVICRKAI